MPDSPIQKIVCCMGLPVAGNPTQFMMERAFSAAGLDWRYLTLEVAPNDLATAIGGMRSMGFRGGNFTLPHKVSVIEHLDRLSEAAQLMGAVNCVSNENGALVGENTDGKGFVESLRQITDPTGKRIVLFGGGGAARAIAVELALAGVESMTIANRTAERGESLVALLNERTETPAEFVLWDSEFSIPEDADVVINATSIGLGAPQDRLPIVAESFCDSQVVADVVFNPVHTRFLKEARDQGCRTLDGLGMLVNQGVIGFQIWTGIEPDRAIMREALEEYLEI